MLDTVSRYFEGMRGTTEKHALRRVIEPLADRYSSLPLTTAGLAINGAAATLPKIGAADFYAVAKGSLVKVVAGTALPALTGISAPAGGFNVALYFVDNAGALTVAGGTPAATLGGVRFPQLAFGKALIGFLIISNAAAFVGGTTALDAGTTIYVSPSGPCDPTVLT